MSGNSVMCSEDGLMTLDVYMQPVALAMNLKRIFHDEAEINEWASFIITKIGRPSPTVVE